MDNLYTPEIHYHITTAPWPKELVYDIEVWDDHIKLIFYNDNFNTLSGDALASIGTTVMHVIQPLRDKGVPIFLDRRESKNG